MIQVYTAHTPNGIKIPIALEELCAPYRLTHVPIGDPILQSTEFLRINPNGKIPAICDLDEANKPVYIFESGAILLYLGERFGGLLGDSTITRAQTLSWLFLQVAGLGPMMGNAAHFRGLADTEQYALGRFQAEARRYLGLLDTRLNQNEWLNGESYSIADIAHYSWARSAEYAGLSLDEFPWLRFWVQKIEMRPAVLRALSKIRSMGQSKQTWLDYFGVSRQFSR